MDSDCFDQTRPKAKRERKHHKLPTKHKQKSMKSKSIQNSSRIRTNRCPLQQTAGVLQKHSPCASETLTWSLTAEANDESGRSSRVTTHRLGYLADGCVGPRKPSPVPALASNRRETVAAAIKTSALGRIQGSSHLPLLELVRHVVSLEEKVNEILSHVHSHGHSIEEQKGLASDTNSFSEGIQQDLKRISECQLSLARLITLSAGRHRRVVRHTMCMKCKRSRRRNRAQYSRRGTRNPRYYDADDEIASTDSVSKQQRSIGPEQVVATSDTSVRVGSDSGSNELSTSSDSTVQHHSQSLSVLATSVSTPDSSIPAGDIPKVICSTTEIVTADKSERSQDQAKFGLVVGDEESLPTSSSNSVEVANWNGVCLTSNGQVRDTSVRNSACVSVDVSLTTLSTLHYAQVVVPTVGIMEKNIDVAQISKQIKELHCVCPTPTVVDCLHTDNLLKYVYLYQYRKKHRKKPRPMPMPGASMHRNMTAADGIGSCLRRCGNCTGLGIEQCLFSQHRHVDVHCSISGPQTTHADDNAIMSLQYAKMSTENNSPPSDRRQYSPYVHIQPSVNEWCTSFHGADSQQAIGDTTFANRKQLPQAATAERLQPTVPSRQQHSLQEEPLELITCEMSDSDGNRLSTPRDPREKVVVSEEATTGSAPSSDSFKSSWLQKDISGTVDSSNEQVVQFKYQELEQVTDGFDSRPTKEGGHEIGDGRFAELFYARIEAAYVDAKEVVIKKFKQPKSSEQSEVKLYRRQFPTEVMALTRCHHPNIVRLIGQSAEGPELCLVFEYMPGGTLALLLTKNYHNSPQWHVRLRIVCEIARAVNYLHNLCSPGLIHRHLKSANVLISAECIGKLSDFGLSIPVENEEDPLASFTVTAAVGERSYMAPEAFMGRVSPRVDIYSFGMVIYEVVAGLPPFSVVKNVDLVTFMRDLERQGTDLAVMTDPRAKWGLDVAADLFKLARWCTDYDSHRRPQISVVVSILEMLMRDHWQQPF